MQLPLWVKPLLCLWMMQLPLWMKPLLCLWMMQPIVDDAAPPVGEATPLLVDDAAPPVGDATSLLVDNAASLVDAAAPLWVMPFLCLWMMQLLLRVIDATPLLALWCSSLLWVMQLSLWVMSFPLWMMQLPLVGDAVLPMVMPLPPLWMMHSHLVGDTNSLYGWCAGIVLFKTFKFHIPENSHNTCPL